MRQAPESYYATEPDRTEALPKCVVRNCGNPPIAEVFTGCYSEALRIFRGINRQVIQSRRMGDERFFSCQKHLDTDERMAKLLWQMLLPQTENV